MYSGLLIINYCLREATSALRQNKLACHTPWMQAISSFYNHTLSSLRDTTRKFNIA